MGPGELFLFHILAGWLAYEVGFALGCDCVLLDFGFFFLQTIYISMVGRETFLYISCVLLAVVD
jgi:hypothetical protein